MRLYQTSKKILSVTPNAVDFLNGLTSNSMEAHRNAFLNIHGRIIAVFDQIHVDAETMWLVMEADLVGTVRKHLERYALVSGVQIELIERNVYFDLDGDFVLGEREYAVSQPKGQLVVTPNVLSCEVSEEEFTAFRLDHAIPLQGVDFKDELLLNVSETEYVSFTKGCYLGQEPISKVHHRSKPTWKLVVKSEGDCTPDELEKITSKSQAAQSGETRGFVFVKNL